ncbi:hypothetical protein GL2_40970 [Microbulbifer sp. GL-2]|nr:hypothetical protein GL2_40970 [Microbulbifer sp. GL-2]
MGFIVQLKVSYVINIHLLIITILCAYAFVQVEAKKKNDALVPLGFVRNIKSISEGLVYFW